MLFCNNSIPSIRLLLIAANIAAECRRYGCIEDIFKLSSDWALINCLSKLYEYNLSVNRLNAMETDLNFFLLLEPKAKYQILVWTCVGVTFPRYTYR